MKRLLLTALHVARKPITVAIILGVLAGWLFAADYVLRLLWCRPLPPGIGLIALSANGVSCLYTKDESTPYRYWFQGNKSLSPIVEVQAPDTVVFTGSHFFSDNGNLFAINGMYLKRSGSFLFVFDTNTGKLVYDVPSSGERACFSRSGDLLVVDGRGLQCWDLRQHRQLPEVSHENPFILEDLIFAHQRDYLYYLSADYEGTPSESNPPKIMHLCCWSVPEKREVFRVRLGEANFPIPWYLRIDEHDRFLFAVSVSLFSDSSGHYRDENVIYCLDANDGHLVRQFSKQGGESYDPVYPMDQDHIIVFRDSQLHPIRFAWQKLVGKEPQWLKSTFPNRSTLDLRDVETGRTVELLSLGPGHWPRFDNCFGAGLATRFEVNGTEEVALWSIEKRGRYFDALLLGAEVTLATWISLVILRRVWGRLKPNH